MTPETPLPKDSIEKVKAELMEWEEEIQMVKALREMANGDNEKAFALLTLYLITVPKEEDEDPESRRGLVAMMAAYLAWTTDYEPASEQQPANVE